MTFAMLRGTIIFTSPLILTTGYHHPGLTAVGFALQYFLGSRTYNSLTNRGKINQAVESAAILSLTTTSYTNRSTRVLLGLVHACAAALLAWRAQKWMDNGENSDKEKSNSNSDTPPSTLVQLCTKSFWQAAAFGGILGLSSIAATWFSSGYYAQ